MLTTDGVTFSSTGASEGKGSPSIAAGIAARLACAARIKRTMVDSFNFSMKSRCTTLSPVDDDLPFS
jgi:hypothetical protein